MTIRHVQTWALIAFYETFIVTFTRSWMSNRRSVALAQMLCLHCIDMRGGPGHLPMVFRDEIDVEQGRRVFWQSFLSDRWASSGMGLPTSIQMEDVSTASVNLSCRC